MVICITWFWSLVSHFSILHIIDGHLLSLSIILSTREISSGDQSIDTVPVLTGLPVTFTHFDQSTLGNRSCFVNQYAHVSQESRPNVSLVHKMHLICFCWKKNGSHNPLSWFCDPWLLGSCLQLEKNWSSAVLESLLWHNSSASSISIHKTMQIGLSRKSITLRCNYKNILITSVSASLRMHTLNTRSGSWLIDCTFEVLKNIHAIFKIQRL